MSQGLKGISIESATVSMPENSETKMVQTFSVQGLSLTDMVSIYRRHQGDLALWFERLVGGAVDDQVAEIAASLMDSSQDMAFEIIAAGSGLADAETIAIAAKLPVAVQVDALSKIGRLTFTSEMPPKKLIETVINAAQLVNQPTSPVESAT